MAKQQLTAPKWLEDQDNSGVVLPFHDFNDLIMEAEANSACCDYIEPAIATFAGKASFEGQDSPPFAED